MSKLAAVPDPIDTAIQRTEAQAVQPRMHMEIPSVGGNPIVLEFSMPLTPIDIVNVLLAVSDIVTGRATQAAADPAKQRIWTPTK